MTGMLSPAVPAGVPGEGPPQMPFTGDQQQVGDSIRAVSTNRST
jgi:hypothetical protein